MHYIKPKMVAIHLTKDKSTVVAKVVPVHELLVLEHLFGDGAVQELDDYQIEKEGMDVQQLKAPISALGEFARLERCYGIDSADPKGRSVAEVVFGHRTSTVFLEAAGGVVPVGREVSAGKDKAA